MKCPGCKITMVHKAADNMIPHDRYVCPTCLREVRDAGSPVKETGADGKKTLLG